MDNTDRKILQLLAEDARRSLADIGSAASLAPSSVNERIRKLVADGVIRRFTVDLDPEKLATPVAAYIWAALKEGADETSFRTFVRGHPSVTECHHVTGAWSYLLKVQVKGLTDLEDVLTHFKEAGLIARSETVIALSTVVEPPYIPKEFK